MKNPKVIALLVGAFLLRYLSQQAVAAALDVYKSIDEPPHV